MVLMAEDDSVRRVFASDSKWDIGNGHITTVRSLSSPKYFGVSYRYSKGFLCTSGDLDDFTATDGRFKCDINSFYGGIHDEVYIDSRWSEIQRNSSPREFQAIIDSVLTVTFVITAVSYYILNKL